MRQGILFATPCYGGNMLEAHFRSCMDLKEKLSQIGLEHDWLTGRNESLVHRGRMEMVATFLNQTDYSHLMFLDADIEFTADDVAKVWNLEADIGVGVYTMKKRNQCWYAAWKDGQLVRNLDQFTGPTEVDYAGTGFMLIRREVLEQAHAHLLKQQNDVERMLWHLAGHLPQIPEYEKLISTIVERFAPSYMGPNGRVPALFMTPIHGDTLESEDYYFSRLAREAGFKVIMDPSVRLKHWGQYDYGAN